MEAVSGAKSGTLKFIRTLTNISKDAGGVAHMRCEVVGDPPPTKIKWFKNEAPLEEKRPKITIKKIHAQVTSTIYLSRFFFFIEFFLQILLNFIKEEELY